MKNIIGSKIRIKTFTSEKIAIFGQFIISIQEIHEIIARTFKNKFKYCKYISCLKCFINIVKAVCILGYNYIFVLLYHIYDRWIQPQICPVKFLHNLSE